MLTCLPASPADAGTSATERSSWQEDTSWTLRLDQGWDLNRVRQTAQKMIDKFGQNVHFVDDGSEHR